MKSIKIYYLTLLVLLITWLFPNIEKAVDNNDYTHLVSAEHFRNIKNNLLYQLNISAEPDNVLIGKEDFLFLGQHYDWSINQYTNSVNYDSVALKQANISYQAFFSQTGIPILYNVIPSKISVYPEYADWNFLKEDVPMEGIRKAISFDGSIIEYSLPYLIQKKTEGYLYYNWDTHWNELGAFFGYQFVMNKLKKKNSLNLSLVTDIGIEQKSYPDKSHILYPRDLSDMLGISYNGAFRNAEFDDYWESNMDRFPISVSKFDHLSYTEKKFKHNVKNYAIDNNHGSFVINSPEALNGLKLLWIRDSFGKASSKYYHATFSDVLSIHPMYLNSESLTRIYEKFPFDLIIISLAERQALAYFKKLSSMVQSFQSLYRVNNGTAVIHSLSSEEFVVNAIVDNIGSGRFVSNGVDPQMLIKSNVLSEFYGSCEFKVALTVSKRDTFQIFAREEKQAFSEDNSYKFGLEKGQNNITFKIPEGAYSLRIDPIQGQGHYTFEQLNLICDRS